MVFFNIFYIFKKLTVIFYIQQDANALAVFIHYKTFFQRESFLPVLFLFQGGG